MIDLQHITKRFGTVTAVDDITLAIGTGEFLTLLGPSGCGKTTLLRTISGFERPDIGRVILDGQTVTDLPPYRRDVNQVFQSYALFPHLNVRKNIAFGLRMKKLPQAEIARRVEEVVALVELAGMEDRKPHQLSGGQRQRVALARAIVNRPKVLLLDEPLAALDAKLRHAMQVELKRLQRKLGITFVFVTHDQAEALVMSDRIVVMNQGRIEQLGTPADVYHKPASLFVGQFIGHANLWQTTVTDGRTARIGDIELPVNVPASAGPLTVLVRPEHVILGSAGGFIAEVTEIHFTGAVSHVRLITPGGIEVQATVPHATYSKGQRLTCSIPPQAVTVIG